MEIIIMWRWYVIPRTSIPSNQFNMEIVKTQPRIMIIGIPPNRHRANFFWLTMEEHGTRIIHFYQTNELFEISNYILREPQHNSYNVSYNVSVSNTSIIIMFFNITPNGNIKPYIYLTRMWNMISSPATPTVCLEQKYENFQSRDVTFSMPSPSQK